MPEPLTTQPSPEDSPPAPAPSKPKPPAGSKRGASSRYSQIIAMQRVLLAVVLDNKVSARERASCAIAWDKLEDRTRILRGKPLPGQYRPEVKAKPKALPLWSGPTEA